MAKVTGEGTIVQLEKDKPKSKCRKWQLRVPVGLDPRTGKYKTRTRRVSDVSYTQAKKALRDFIDEHFTLCDLQGGVFELSLIGVDKGTGIEAALAHLGRGVKDTFAFGDSENDLPMRGAVDTFVAKGNALENVREVADYVTGTAAEEGVPAALERFGLI